ncbi:MAG: cytochrome c biogenesis protein CcsA [Bacteriovoracaceae bacterium]
MTNLLRNILITLLLMSGGQLIAEKLNFNHFSIIPILAEGRIKPLDTFARVNLLGIYQKSQLKEQSAIEWLAELLFDRDKAFRHRVFKIKNPEVVNALSLEPNDQHIYSFAQLVENFKKISPMVEKIFQMEAATRSPVQKQLLDLYLKVVNFQRLSESVTLLIPKLEAPSQSFADKVGLPFGKKITYLEVLKHQGAISKLTETIFKKKKEDLNEEDFKIIQFIETLEQIAPTDGAKDFRVIPPQFSVGIEKEWLAPWPVLTTGMGSPQTVELFHLWTELYEAYQTNNSEAFEKTSEKIYQTTVKYAGLTVSPQKLVLEKLYNQYDLFVKAIAFYILSFLLLAASSLGKKELLSKLSFYSLFLGAIPHFTNLTLRCYLKSRPPVSTLYESILFVAIIAVIGAILIEMRKKSSVGTFVGSILGTILLFISFGYEKDGDSMGMLVAVLDTNFWLATHVVSITIGYGCCFVLSVLGHVYLIWNMFPQKFNKSTTELDSLLKSMQGTSLFALFFAVLGTILGGIWADQSWGRFWGWDPKENGALLICLWLLFAIHGRMLGYFKKNTLAMVMSVTSIIVVIAWFGVNLLNVGLHSYGFTDSIAINILIFSLIEIAFIVVAGWKIKEL